MSSSSSSSSTHSSPPSLPSQSDHNHSHSHNHDHDHDYANQSSSFSSSPSPPIPENPLLSSPYPPSLSVLISSLLSNSISPSPMSPFPFLSSPSSSFSPLSSFSLSNLTIECPSRLCCLSPPSSSSSSSSTSPASDPSHSLLCDNHFLSLSLQFDCISQSQSSSSSSSSPSISSPNLYEFSLILLYLMLYYACYRLSTLSFILTQFCFKCPHITSIHLFTEFPFIRKVNIEMKIISSTNHQVLSSLSDSVDLSHSMKIFSPSSPSLPSWGFPFELLPFPTDINEWGTVDIIVETNKDMYDSFSSSDTNCNDRHALSAPEGSGNENLSSKLPINSLNNHHNPIHLPTESISCGLYILNISPHGIIPSHYHTKMSEREMSLSHGEITCNGHKMQFGDLNQWRYHDIHSYQNVDSIHPHSILCIDTPAFERSDEIAANDLVNHKGTIVEGKSGFDMRKYISQNIQYSMRNENDDIHRKEVKQHISSNPIFSPLSFSFPSTYTNQWIHLTPLMTKANSSPSPLLSSTPHAVLLFCWNERNECLFVQHKERGVELIGGKVEENESVEDAVIREAREEGAVEVKREQLVVIAQYEIHHVCPPSHPLYASSTSSSPSPSSSHVKRVYSCRISSSTQLLNSDSIKKETTRRVFLPKDLQWREWIRGKGKQQGGESESNPPGILLLDNVFPICWELSHQSLSLE